MDTSQLLKPEATLADYKAVALSLCIKRDFSLAARVLYQAAVCFPQYFADLEGDLFRVREENQREILHAHTKSARLFDFLILPSLMSASSLIEYGLTLHPETYVPRKNDLDNSLLYGQLGSFLNSYRTLLSASDSEVRAGLIMHQFLMQEKHIAIAAALLSKICSDKKCIQIVRDPLLAFLSDFRHQAIVTLCGGYSFQALGLSWPEKNSLNTLTGFTLNLEQLNSFFNSFAKDKILYNSIELEFSKYFKEITLLDFSEITKEKGLTAIFSALNLKDQSYHHPLYDRPAYNLAMRVMDNNYLSLKIESHTLRVRLAYAFQGFLDPTAQSIELAKVTNDERIKDSDLGERDLALTISLKDWQSIPFAIQRKLIEGRFFQKIFEEKIIPNWLDNWNLWRAKLADLIKPELRDAQQKFALDQMRNQVLEFAKRHPSKVEAWQTLQLL